jgi:hypothetical protein
MTHNAMCSVLGPRSGTLSYALVTLRPEPRAISATVSRFTNGGTELMSTAKISLLR